MSKPYGTGLIVGKFSPLHKGHLHLFATAASLCDEVIVISYSSPELPGCDAKRREGWLKGCFPDATILVVTQDALERRLPGRHVPIPANDAPDFDHREFVALLCEDILERRIDAVFTSENYGDGFAAHLTKRLRTMDGSSKPVRHVMVDRQRQAVPISATQLRANPWRHWEFLPEAVARTLTRRITFIGGESSGKTTLAACMAEELATQWVPEYGRELWEAKQGALEYEDFVQIAREQIRREDSALPSGRGFLFCDTSPLTTLFYCLDIFGKAEPELMRAAQRGYALVVLCAPDFAFVQDGTRRDEAFRQRQHAWYQAQLAERGVPYVIARGSLPERIRYLRQLLRVC